MVSSFMMNIKGRIEEKVEKREEKKEGEEKKRGKFIDGHNIYN